jgi:hypothetical protein
MQKSKQTSKQTNKQTKMWFNKNMITKNYITQSITIVKNIIIIQLLFLYVLI